MWNVRIYILTEQKGNTIERGRAAYELETERANGRTSAIDDHVGLVEWNRNGATLEGLIGALNRLNSGMDISVSLFTEAPLINSQIMARNMEKWEKAGYKTSKGEPVKYAGLWETINELLKEKVKGGITSCDRVPLEKQKILEEVIRKE